MWIIHNTPTTFSNNPLKCHVCQKKERNQIIGHLQVESSISHVVRLFNLKRRTVYDLRRRDQVTGPTTWTSQDDCRSRSFEAIGLKQPRVLQTLPGSQCNDCCWRWTYLVSKIAPSTLDPHEKTFPTMQQYTIRSQ